ncbi:unnamed protein product [Parajaminaea phylloscopi]
MDSGMSVQAGLAGRRLDTHGRFRDGPVDSQDVSNGASPSGSLDAETDTSHDSLFSENGLTDDEDNFPACNERPDLPMPDDDEGASREAPLIPGLHFFDDLLSPELEKEILKAISNHSYLDPHLGRNQAMLFGRAKTPPRPTLDHECNGGDGKDGVNGAEQGDRNLTGLPGWADGLVHTLQSLLKGRLDPRTRELLFPSLLSGESGTAGETSDASPGVTSPQRSLIQPCRSRQLIINHYQPGEGISAHVDLPTRFGDGIILCSLQAGICMDFTPLAGDDPGRHKSSTECDGEGLDGEHELHELHELPNKRRRPNTHTPESRRQHSLWLPPRSVLVLSGEARWQWKHGIAARQGDWVRGNSSFDHDGNADSAQTSPMGWIPRRLTSSRPTRVTDRVRSTGYMASVEMEGVAAPAASTSAASAEHPSLVQRYILSENSQLAESNGNGQISDHEPQDPATVLASLITSLNAASSKSVEGKDGAAATTPADLLALLPQITTSLASLRSTSHSLSDAAKEERAAIAAARQKVDEARLALENARLEEGELREEIRREEME